MTNSKIQEIFSYPEVYRRIFAQLSNKDLLNCASVDKTWFFAVKDAKSALTININVELLKEINNKKIQIQDFIKKNYSQAKNIDIRGWSRNTYVPNEIYDNLFGSNVTARSLTLRGRGTWNTCHCPKETSIFGKQFGTINDEDKTNLEQIYIGTTFQIASCALLDLISRSPRLKVLKFYGILVDPEHCELFKAKRFCSNLEAVYWPWPKRKHLLTLTTIIKRNENVTTLYTNGEITCDLLASDTLPNLRFLSLNLNDNWNCKPNQLKKVYRYVEKTKYLSLAKNLEALEIRTYDLVYDEVDESKSPKDKQAFNDTKTKVERIFEQYKSDFWEQIGTLQKLRYLAIYGAWEFEEVCRKISQNKLPIEYLRIHLIPNSVITAVENYDDQINLSIAEGVKNLRKILSLRSLYYTCYEKLTSVDAKTTAALKELIDLIWSFDIKTLFTSEMEDFFNTLVKRGNQLGKTYKVILHVQSKSDQKDARFVIEQNLKSVASNLRPRLTEIAENECVARYGESLENIHIWGFEQMSSRDNEAFRKLKSDWQFYQDRFNHQAAAL